MIGALIALVMLASMGIAFAMWSETLRINVTVNTGEVNVEIVDAYTSDETPPPWGKEQERDTYSMA